MPVIEKTLQDLYTELQMTYRTSTASRGGGSEDVFIVKLVQTIMTYGRQVRASDIHLEPSPTQTCIRYRIDGMLHQMLQMPPEIGDLLIRSIKVKASMSTDGVGRSKPQDARIDFAENGRVVDLRVSSFPTIHGDVLAIRMLDRTTTRLSLDQTGFSHETLQQYEQLLRRPNGLILVTGPANSGKTTTLYGALEKLRSPHIKIVTLEDPVEYQMEGIAQSQINPQVGVTFATGLRAILRQDANIILVGEIRDSETADIAIRAALTGHLVLSTLHTRHSCGAVTRLINMDVEPYLIVTSVNGIIAQRLVRVLCMKCKQPDPGASSVFMRVWTKETTMPPLGAEQAAFCKPVGCAACSGTGYYGRTGIFELLTITEELRSVILDRTSDQLYKMAMASGMKTMFLDGLDKVAQGQTTIEEVLRVTGVAEGF